MKKYERHALAIHCLNAAPTREFAQRPGLFPTYGSLGVAVVKIAAMALAVVAAVMLGARL